MQKPRGNPGLFSCLTRQAADFSGLNFGRLVDRGVRAGAVQADPALVGNFECDFFLHFCWLALFLARALFRAGFWWNWMVSRR